MCLIFQIQDALFIFPLSALPLMLTTSILLYKQI